MNVKPRGEVGEVRAMYGERMVFLTFEFDTTQRPVADLNVIATEELTTDLYRLELRAVGQEKGECGGVYSHSR